MPLSSIAVQRPVTTLMFTAGLVMLGVVALTTLSVDFLPAIDIPKLTVQTSCPNTSPEEVEHAVTQPIESALGTVAGVKRIRSITREGMSAVTVEFAWGTAMDFALLEVREKLDQVGGSLPRESDRPTILSVDPSAEPVMTIALASADRQPRDSIEVLTELKETARALVKRRIEQVQGVAQAAVLGGVEREIHVDVNPAALQALGLTIGQLSEVLASANMNLPGGTITYGLFRYSLRTLGEFQDCEDIRNTVIRQTDLGRPIRVRDCATVRDTHRERYGLTRYNGKEVILVQVRKEAGANTVDVSRSVRSVLDQLRSENPSLLLAVVADQAEFISRSIADVQQAILIGAVLAFVVLFYFLRQPRYPVIIGITMPVSILATMVAMYFLKINLNVISLTGLALGIGMLGDNAIVLIENVTRLREQGMPLREATLEGAQEIGTAVTASTLTNVAIFLPIVFVEGVAAQLFVDMGITMAISLVVSLVVAVTLVPMLVSRETSRLVRVRPLRIPQDQWTPVPAALASMIDRFDEQVRATVECYLAWALDHRSAVLLTTVGLLLLSILVASMIPGEPSPDIDQTRFIVQLRMPRGTSLEGVSAFSRFLEDRLRTTRGVKGVLARVGITEEQSFWSADETSAEISLLEVNAEDPEQIDPLMDSTRILLNRYAATTSGVEFAVKPYGTSLEQVLTPEPNDVSCRIAGRDPATVERLAGIYAERIRSVVGLVDLRVSLQAGTPEYHIAVDREAANRHGLSVHAVASHLAHTVRGNEATTLSDFDKKITIRVQSSGEFRRDIDALLGSSIIVDGRGVPVRSLVSWRETEGYGEIWREGQQRVHVLAANVSGRSVGSVVSDLETIAEGLRLPPGYTIAVGGENEEIRESFRGLSIVILLSLCLVFMILAAEYESILYPLVILLTSPLAFIGAILAMVLTGQHFNVISLVGLVIMIGAVDNDAVILVDLITELRREGAGVREAILRGMNQRLRPILMTTATTVLGVIPLVFEFGRGSELVRALTTPLVGGLVASTFFTVAVIPVVYASVDRWARSRQIHPQVHPGSSGYEG